VAEEEIVVVQGGEPVAIAGADRPVASTRSVDLVVSLLLLAFAALMGWDNWRTGAAWAADGPEAGYFPFYLSVLLAAASLYGLVTTWLAGPEADQPFVTREQGARVLQVLVPTLLFVAATAFLGIYVASFILTAAFMWFIGRIRPWIAFVTAVVFSVAMFLTFEVAFNVIMPKGPLEAAFGY
jgi:putative tricarboxylic transport membrane protein